MSKHASDLFLVLGTLLVVAMPHDVHAISIRLSGSASDYQCQQNAPLHALTRLFVSASSSPVYPTDPITSGIVSAEFRLAGFDPQSVVVSAQPPPGAILEGDPFGGGCRVTFGSCQTWGGMDCSVPLLQIDMFVVQPFEATLLVQPSPHPCQGMIPSPLVTSCEDPATHVCATGIGMCINATVCSFCPLGNVTGDCVLAVTPTSWSGLKALYKK